jgi:L,D-transpeptidase ErfK/SrfK
MRAQISHSVNGRHHNHTTPRFDKVLTACVALSLLMTSAAFAADKSVTANTIGTPRIITAEYKDTLPAIAEREQVGYAELLAANPGVDPLMPGDGTKLILPTQKLIPNAVPHEGLILNVGELRLYYFPKDGSTPRSFPIGIGREGLNTPMGTTTVTRKMPNPPWHPTPRMLLENPELNAEVKGGDEENPLGKYALYLGWPSYLIHGTSKPKAVGRRASSGCIRMYANDIKWIFENVPVGTKVTSVNQPVKMAWIDGALFIEATPSDIQIDELEYQSQQKTVSVDDGTIARILQFAGDKAEQIDWHKTRQVLINRTGVPTQITSGKMVELGASVHLTDQNTAQSTPSAPAVATQTANAATPAVNSVTDMTTVKPTPAR